MKQCFQRALGFAKSEAVLSIAALLAVGSMAAVPPDKGYLDYIDWDTLALLFSLMAVSKGLQGQGVFDALGAGLLGRLSTTRQMLLVLTFLPFFVSMLVTNDVALITFVPFGLVVLEMAGCERLAIPLVVLQTAAANLGSMLTPMGNPQNLYLYGKSGMGFGGLCLLMLPYVAVAGGCLAVALLLRRPSPVQAPAVPGTLAGPRQLTLCTLGFGLCLLGLFQVVNALVVCAILALFLLLTDRALLASVDYSLLGVFAAFFIFIGNLSGVEGFQSILSGALTGHVELVAVLASQVTSNVPAALLLSGFTNQWAPLIVGCNLGGLGTLIASMASLISYKEISRAYPDQRGRYFMVFTLCNVGMLALLLGLSALLGGG